jgi:hypothetical protein
MHINDALIRGTLESHRAELENAKKIRKAATNLTTPVAAVPALPANPPAPTGHSTAQGVSAPPGEEGDRQRLQPQLLSVTTFSVV